jgi:uncharacterized protein
VKLREEFAVPHAVEEVWKFFEQPEAVASCMPGVESITVLDEDNVQVRATQSIGPMTATFDAKVTVLERVPNELIRFRATGRSVRGAIGNLRTENAVHLTASDGGSVIVVDGEVVLAGALGSVGQKVVAKQAGKVTAEFASNLQRALNGEAPATGPARTAHTSIEPTGASDSVQLVATTTATDRWSKLAAGLSALSAILSLLAILRQRRGGASR